MGTAISGRRARVGVLVTAVLVLLLAVAGTALLATSQTAALRELEHRLDARAEAGAALVAVHSDDLLTRARDLGELWLSGQRPQDRLPDVAVALRSRGAVVLDSSGRVLASEPSAPGVVGRDLTTRFPHLAAARAGRPSVSGVVTAATLGVPVVAYAAPIQTPQGRRVVSVAQDVAAGTLRDYLDEAQVLPGSRVYVIDDVGQLVATSSAVGTSSGTLGGVAPALAGAVGTSARAAGEIGERNVDRWTVRAIEGTPWRIVMTVPRAVLLEPLSGTNRWLPWGALAALTVAASGGVLAAARLVTSRARLDALAHVDDLTGLMTRRRVVELLRRDVDTAPVSVLLVDVDHFKRINDTFGHTAGDAALRATADALRGAVRACDAVARWGGEEFLVLLPGADATTAAGVAERVRLAVSEQEVVVGTGGDVITMTASVGCATATAPGTGVDALVHVADRAMYRAKSEGRDRVRAATVPRLAA